jgi:hypothetical protein
VGEARKESAGFDGVIRPRHYCWNVLDFSILLIGHIIYLKLAAALISCIIRMHVYLFAKTKKSRDFPSRRNEKNPKSFSALFGETSPFSRFFNCLRPSPSVEY